MAADQVGMRKWSGLGLGLGLEFGVGDLVAYPRSG